MTARGIRNNNPGNLRKGSDWNGEQPVENMTPAQAAEKAFEVFSCPAYGIRALTKLLLTYQLRYGLDTINEILNRYAPDIENDTSAYARHVSEMTGFGVDESVDLREPEIMKAFLIAIITHENGSNPYTYEIEDGMVLAGLGRV